MSMREIYDVIVIGSGPAGQKAAVQAAKAGKAVALVESDKALGGACVHRGTIPSKTMRENALRISRLREGAELFSYELCPNLEMSVLTDSMNTVLEAHDVYIRDQLERNNVACLHGRASFIDAQQLLFTSPGGETRQLKAHTFIIATGSVPRQLGHMEVDHEFIYDSDSILSMVYLPASLIVLGAGVIASEYASIFSKLGVEVTMIDKYARPLGFLDTVLSERFVEAYSAGGGTFIANANVKRVHWDGVSQVVAELDDGTVYHAEKALCATGRVSNVKALNIENAGLALNEHGVISVDSDYRTVVPSIFAVGDVIGPPSLASASMEQGRRAARAAVGLNSGEISRQIPMGIYAIPELSTVGMTEVQAREAYGDVLMGEANFSEIARGQISRIQDGMLRLIADPKGEILLGVQIIGEGATELIHIGQMALQAGMPVDTFVENIFNFPTMAEAYRVAALDLVSNRVDIERPKQAANS